MVAVRWLLFPFSVLYAAATSVRNWLYDRELLRSHRFAAPVLSVGNLTVGGTGKTPHTEYLVRLLGGQFAVVTLSRGYGRATRGFRIAAATDTAAHIGDEPLQLYRKFAGTATVTVGEDRVAALRKIFQLPGVQAHARPPVVLLDDAFQHRPVRPSFSMLLTDYHRPFYQDWLLPAGNLRETRTGARRAHAVVVSKCPATLSQTEREGIEAALQAYLQPGTPVFFTAVQYGRPVAFQAAHPEAAPPGKVLLVTGIARPEPLRAYVRETFGLSGHLAFRDHHAYSPADMEAMRRQCQRLGTGTLLTTEKDYVKLRSLPLPLALDFYYLPIEVRFLFGQQAAFDRLVVQQAGGV